MTRRNEDSGLIDLDALMRQATAKEAVELHEARPESGRAPTPTPTPPPVAVRSVLIEGLPPPPASSARASVPTLAPTPVVMAAPVDSKPAVESKPVESKPAAVESKPAESKPAAVESKPKSEPTAKSAPIVLDRRPANDVTPDAPAVAVAPVAAKVAKSVPPAPSTMPSKLQPDSLEGVTTTEPGADPWVAPASKGAAASTSDLPILPAKAQPKRSRKPYAVGALVAIIGLLGVGALVRSRHASVTPASAAVSPTPIQPTSNTKATATPAVEAPPEVNPGLNADQLPVVASAAPSAHVAAHGARAGAGNKGDGKPAPAATLTEANLEASPTTGAGDLGDAMKGAVGPRDQANADTADKSAGSNASQVRPSPGAVVGALGSVLPAARACLSPDDTVRSGLVVFKSDGTVARVELKGGKPEDDCVRSALAKAKLAPFVDETFSTRVTVRP